MTNKLDWDLLRRQKEWLLSKQGDAWAKCGDSDLIDGLVNMIDSIQDYAVENNEATELEVFGELSCTSQT